MFDLQLPDVGLRGEEIQIRRPKSTFSNGKHLSCFIEIINSLKIELIVQSGRIDLNRWLPFCDKSIKKKQIVLK